MAPSRNYKCGACDAAVVKSKGSILCSKCGLWIHLTCAKVNDKHLALFYERPESFSFTCDSCLKSNPSNDIMLQAEVRALNNSFNEFVNDYNEQREQFKASIIQAISEFKSDINSGIVSIKADVDACVDRVSSIDSSVMAKLSALEMENDTLHRRINRANFVISGLPAGLKDLVSVVTALCAFFRLEVSANDICHVCYMNKNKMLLVKLNNVTLRDKIMKMYFGTRSLKLSDIIGGDIDSRVYLNEHFSPITSKLNNLCRKLRKLKVISKFKILNNDGAKAKLTLIGGSEVIHDFDGCAALLSGSHVS